MTLTVNALTYNVDSQRSPDIVRYSGPSNTLSTKDYIDLYRTSPKPTATFAGVGKAEAKLTRTLTDGADVVGTGILQVQTSFPVGASSTEMQAMVDDLAAWLATSAATDLFLNHDVNQ